MKRFLYLLFILFCLPTFAYSCEIVYPTGKNVTINADKTFFAGSETKTSELTINGKKIKLSKDGAFYYPVKLQKGENIFKIDNGETVLTYTIVNNNDTETSSVQDTPITRYKESQIYVTNQDNVPLRSEACDCGINRLQHFPKGVPLTIVGEKGDFYMVELMPDLYAWVAKNSVTNAKGYNNSPAKIEYATYEEDEVSRTYTLKLNKKVPYILSETRTYQTIEENKKPIPQNSGLDIDVYNVEGFENNNYRFHIDSTFPIFGYTSYFEPSRALVIKVKKVPLIDKTSPLKDKTITIDPGHGGQELGALGCLGTKEKQVNLDIALKLKKQLEDAGAKVILTRSDDSDVSLPDRVDISNQNNSDVFISIHNNSIPDSKAFSKPSGTSIYYYYYQSAQLANDILENMCSKLQSKNNGIIQESFAVIRNTQSPAVLIEVGYMINPVENEKLITDEYQNNVAQSIKNGLEKYFCDFAK